MVTENHVATLADNTSIDPDIEGNGRFPLPSKSTLLAVSLQLNSAGQGPCKGSVNVRFSDTKYLVLRRPRWLRGDPVYGFRDAWTWTGEVSIGEKENASIGVLLRNDTGAEVGWSVVWTYRRGE